MDENSSTGGQVISNINTLFGCAGEDASQVMAQVTIRAQNISCTEVTKMTILRFWDGAQGVYRNNTICPPEGLKVLHDNNGVVTESCMGDHRCVSDANAMCTPTETRAISSVQQDPLPEGAVGGSTCRPLENPEAQTCDTSICFSGESPVRLANGMTIPMKDLRIGDLVETSSNLFLQIVLGNGAKLELSPNHLVFRNTIAVPAADLNVGDQLSDGVVVRQIHTVKRQGLYAPYTASGTIVVAGVQASVYASLAEGPLRGEGSVQLHDWIHLFTTHHRLLCNVVVCRDNEMSPIAAWNLRIYMWWTKLESSWLRNVLADIAVVFLGCFRLIEIFVDSTDVSLQLLLLLLITSVAALMTKQKARSCFAFHDERLT